MPYMAWEDWDCKYYYTIERWIRKYRTSYRCGHFNSSYSLITMGRNRSISRIGSLIRQATADVSGQAKASDTTTSSVVASVRTFSNNAKRTEASNITNTIRQALFRSSHGVGTSFGDSVDMWDQHVGGV